MSTPSTVNPKEAYREWAWTIGWGEDALPHIVAPVAFEAGWKAGYEQAKKEDAAIVAHGISESKR